MGSGRYIIRGGIPGRERLRALARVMQPTAHALLRRAGIAPGMSCLEVGCGGGDLAFDMARMIGPAGRVVGTDIDEMKLELARDEAAAQQLKNTEFRLADITRTHLDEGFDLAHARFVLTHLVEPGAALVRMRDSLRPGGVVVLEDIDFRGCFCHPDSGAYSRYVELYTETVRRRGADANIGPRLPGLLAAAGFEDIRMNVVQPAGDEAEINLMSPLTMENIAEAVLAEECATLAEIEGIVEELYRLARTPGAILSLPRVVEAWGKRAA